MPIVFGIIVYRGFSLGYTISSCVVTFGFNKGIAFILITMLLQNLILIPAILALAVSRIQII